jgi:hypothetical protein
VVIRVRTEDFKVLNTDKSSEQDYGIKKTQNWKCKWCDCSIKRGGQIYYKNIDSNNQRISNMIALCKQCYHEAKQIDSDNSSYLGILFR